MSQSSSQASLSDYPFDLANESAYLAWRKDKLNDAKPEATDLLVKVKNPYQLTQDEVSAITERCCRYNMAIYQLQDTQLQDKSLVHDLGEQLGLSCLDANLRADEDSVSSLQVREQVGNQYIPYTNKALSWHTDGYYKYSIEHIVWNHVGVG